MSATNYNDLKQRSEEIKNETVKKANTAQRVGSLFEDINDTYNDSINSKLDADISAVQSIRPIKTINNISIEGVGNDNLTLYDLDTTVTGAELDQMASLVDTALQPSDKTDLENEIALKQDSSDLGTAAFTDSSDYATAAQGVKADTSLQSVVAGNNVTIDNTDPLNPVINSTGGGSGSGNALVYFDLTEDYILTLADKGKTFINQTTNDYEITIPDNASVDFAGDYAITCIPTSTGKIKVKGVTGVTMQPVQTTTADRPLSILRFGTDNYISIGVKENYTPVVPVETDYFPTGNAASAGAGEADSTNGWTASAASVMSILSVSNTDTEGGSYAISVSNTSVSWRYGNISLTGLSLTPHTATVRMRRVSGTDTPCRLWSNVENIDYTNLNNAVAAATNGNWVEGTVTFTPTDSTVEMRYYSSSPSGETDSEIQISQIIVNED